MKRALWLAAFSFLAGPRSFATPPSSSATTGPVKLTLTLSSKKISRGRPAWFQVTVTNVGREPISIHDRMFCSDTSWFEETWRQNSVSERGLYLRGLDSHRKTRSVDFLPEAPLDCPASIMKRVPPTQEEQRMIREWKTEGLTEDQIYSKLQDHDAVLEKERLEKREQLKFARCPSIELAPGHSISTPRWVDPDMYCGNPGSSPPASAPGRYVELSPNSVFLTPGHHRISAVYDESPEPEIEKELSQKAKSRGQNANWTHAASDVRVETPVIDFEVAK